MGTTVVLDAKTTQAIEEGKNRITMLQVEELRLKNLKKSLEAEIIALEADIDYKEDKVMELGSIIDEHEKELAQLKEQIVILSNEQADRLAEVNRREEDVQAQETALHENELAFNAEQIRLDELIEKYSKDSAVAEKAKDSYEEKIKKIEEFLKSI